MVLYDYLLESAWLYDANVMESRNIVVEISCFITMIWFEMAHFRTDGAIRLIKKSAEVETSGFLRVIRRVEFCQLSRC